MTNAQIGNYAMNVLGIETSCDETAAAVVRDGRQILSNVVASSLGFHRKYAGIVPEIAFRMQLESISSVSEDALKEAGIKLKDIGLISVTCGPGLLGSLLVGISFAKAASFARGIPLLGLNHLTSHIYAAFLDGEEIKFPFVALVVSGGHTSLFYLPDFTRIKLIGSTLDDAAGEAFDKVAKIMGLGYPGGPLIEKLAREGDPGKIKFSCSGTRRPLDFSFSGIKTAVLYKVASRQSPVTSKKDIAASFQETVIDTLIEKSFLACRRQGLKRLVIGGGVVANARLREKFTACAQRKGIKIYFPALPLCTDNAAMVAGLGYRLFRAGQKSGLGLDANLN
jgi:N6-L-threonylcarbamoyladenine synthase